MVAPLLIPLLGGAAKGAQALLGRRGRGRALDDIRKRLTNDADPESGRLLNRLNALVKASGREAGLNDYFQSTSPAAKATLRGLTQRNEGTQRALDAGPNPMDPRNCGRSDN